VLGLERKFRINVAERRIVIKTSYYNDVFINIILSIVFINVLLSINS